ncbi:DUF1449 family protein [Rhodobacteraceae bacterium 2CG4]|uniref:DUF1449 family protein n=1 Tax=Halovulum marinum TaxID=2662447 RepID=A0A6L5Z612_9RHOB|nr:OB-fold-containig protein [Halovulum marinum]MSU92018.1 DUF1449 family protein [Halovulum marinum]
MLDILTQDGMRPFLMAGFLVVFFLVLEVILMFVGLSGFTDADGPDFDGMDADADFSGMTAAEIAADVDVSPDVAAKIESAIAFLEADTDVDVADGPQAGGGTSTLGTVLDLLGLRALPFSASLAIFCAIFASAGIAGQAAAHGIFGFMLPGFLAVPAGIVVAAILTRRFTRFIARLIPRDESYAVSERSLGRRKGTVTVGTAAAGSPAQVRVTDRYGNAQYIMAEPLGAADVIEQGSEVLVVRLPRGGLRLVDLS